MATNAQGNKGRRLRIAAVVIIAWAVLAYLLAPQAWKLFYAAHEPFEGVARVTQTSDGHPGDPINLAVVAEPATLVRAMAAAGWYAADPITLESSLRIAADSVLRRADDQAPVSALYLFGRKQDLAFEQPVPGGPRHRHHVRFWKWSESVDGRPVWFGAGTYDERAGLSYTTGQITHHIAPDVDAERDRIVAELQSKGLVRSVEWKADFQAQRTGRNGGGDPWHTDGRLPIVALQPAPPPPR